MSPRPATSSGADSPGCLIAFFSIFLVAGMFAAGASFFAAEGDLSGRIVGTVIGGVFMLVGGGGVIAGLRTLGRRRAELEAVADDGSAASTTWMSWVPPVSTRRGPGGGRVLPPETSRRAAAIGLGIFALIWNGIVGGAAFGWSRSNDNEFWIPVIFLGLFGFFGLLILLGFVQALLRWLGFGETVVEIDAEPLIPGSEATVTVTQRGSAAINKVVLSVECREKVTFRRGTDTVTEHHTIFEREVASLEMTHAREDRPLLEGRFALPADAPPSFLAANNALLWSVRLVMDLPGRPDIDERFLLRVLPPAAAAEIAAREHLHS